MSPPLLIEKPFVSLVVPTFNVEKYIARCLESCLNQTYQNIEIIVVDDCGSDGSIEIAHQWAVKDSRIKIINSTSNAGTFLARKTGVQKAIGEYILFLDPDDTLLLNTVKILRDEILSSPVDILFFNFTEDSKGSIKKITRKLPETTHVGVDVIKSIFLDINNPPWGIAGKLYSANIAKKAYTAFANFNEKLTYSEDVLFLYAAAIEAGSCRSISNHLYVYFKNDESITEHLTSRALQWKCDQSELSIKHLKEISQRKNLNNPHLGASLSRTIANIRSSMFKLSRHCPGFYGAKNSYVHALVQALRYRKDWKDVARLIVYFLTLSRLKP